METGARGTPDTDRLIGMNGLRGVAALSILTTHVWDYGTPNGRINVGLVHPDERLFMTPRDSLENRIGAR